MPATLNFPPGDAVLPSTPGWYTLPAGCGGTVHGINIADDGKMVCRTDVGGAYVWTGTCADYADPSHRWEQCLHFSSLGSTSLFFTPFFGAWEMVQAPTNSNIILAIFPDLVGTPATPYWVWYSTDRAATWTHSNLSLDDASSNAAGVNCDPKIAIDPVNPNIAYATMPDGGGKSAGAYTSLNKAGGSSLATWTSVKTTGSTEVGPCINIASGGLAFDKSSGSATRFSGQLTTNRIIIPVSGAGIYESTDGGTTFVNTTASGPLSGANFCVKMGGFNAEGVYYCVIVNTPSVGGVWRYKAGVWLRIFSDYAYGTYWAQFAYAPSIIIDPRDNATSKAYLSVFGPTGMAQGITSHDANTAATPTWVATGNVYPAMRSEPYDIGYMNTILGQGFIPSYMNCSSSCIVDPNGRWWWAGNQSIWYLGTSALNSTPVLNPPDYALGSGSTQANVAAAAASTAVALSGLGAGVAMPGSTIMGRGIPDGTTIVSQSSGTTGGAGNYVISNATTEALFPTVAGPGEGEGIGGCVINGLNFSSWSMGRGTEMLVSQEVLMPPGCPYPILAAQDVGAPMRGTFTTYPLTMYAEYYEYIVTHLDYAASDPSFVVARVTDQGGSFQDVTGYSTNYGADHSWTIINQANVPTPMWQAEVIGGISNGSGGSGNILNVTSIVNGTLFPTSYISNTFHGSSTYGELNPYGTGGTTGTGQNTGTYSINGPGGFAAPGSTIHLTSSVIGGQVVAVDHDKWVMLPMGWHGEGIGTWIKPVYTTNATGAATWQFCAGLPAAPYFTRPWAFGTTQRPLAVGYGTDLGTVWAMTFPADYSSGGWSHVPQETNAKVYRSTDSGATFSSTPIASWAVTLSNDGGYCLSVPGRPDELWVTGSFTIGGATAKLWHIRNARTGTPAIVEAVTMPVNYETPVCLTLGAPATEGGYPALYLLSFGYEGIRKLWKGTYSGTGTTVTWALFGPTGTTADLPKSCQVAGYQSISGDWDVHGRLYMSSKASGFAFYHPG